jgi:hypothetical protein
MIDPAGTGLPTSVPPGKDMHIARSVSQRFNEIRLQQAIGDAHRARIEFLRADLFDADCSRCLRRVRDADARVRRLEAALTRSGRN